MEKLEGKIRKRLNSMNWGQLQREFSKTARVWLWKTGLGGLENAAPDLWGLHAVLICDKLRVPTTVFLDQECWYAAIDSDDCHELLERLLSNSSIEIWMRQGWFCGSAELISSEQDLDALFMNHSYEEIFGAAGSIRKKQNKNFKIFRINRTAACTGTDGPGGKSWVWALAAGYFCVLWITKRKK